jgi:hypothetical protein
MDIIEQQTQHLPSPEEMASLANSAPAGKENGTK